MKVKFLTKGKSSIKVSLDDLKSDEILCILSNLSRIDGNFKKDTQARNIMMHVDCLIDTIKVKINTDLADSYYDEVDLANKLQTAIPDLWDLYKERRSPTELTIDQLDTMELFALILLYKFREKIEFPAKNPNLTPEEKDEAHKRLIHAALLQQMEQAPYEKEFIVPTSKYLKACSNASSELKERRRVKKILITD